MANTTFKDENVVLYVKDREKIVKFPDKKFEECLDVLTGWRTNLYKLNEIDPSDLINIEFPTERFLRELKKLDEKSDEYESLLCDLIEEVLFEEIDKRNIDIDKLHYGIEVECDIEYEYGHISKEEYEELLMRFKKNYYKILCVVPYHQVHRDIFYVPQSKIHEFFNKNIYKCYNGNNRDIIHIQPISEEDAKQELEEIKKKIKVYEDQKFREDG